MKTRTRIVIAVLWAMSLVAVGAWTRGQEPILQQAVLYAGDDFGVRVYTPTSSWRPQATLVVRVNGRWHEVELKATPAK
jgi:hypothetical protein